MAENHKLQFLVGTVIAITALIISIIALNKKPVIEIGYDFTSTDEIGIYLRNLGSQSVEVIDLEFIIDSKNYTVTDSTPYDEIIYSLYQSFGIQNIKAKHITVNSRLSSGEQKYFFFLNEDIDQSRKALVCLISNLSISVKVKNNSGILKDSDDFNPLEFENLQLLNNGCDFRIGR